jgi:hypothetical protein
MQMRRLTGAQPGGTREKTGRLLCEPGDMKGYVPAEDDIMAANFGLSREILIYGNRVIIFRRNFLFSLVYSPLNMCSHKQFDRTIYA